MNMPKFLPCVDEGIEAEAQRRLASWRDFKLLGLVSPVYSGSDV